MAEPLRRRLRGALFRVVLPVLSWVLGRLPWRAVDAVGRGLGRLLYLANRRERRRMAEHIALAFPDLPSGERARLARRCATHHGVNLAENLHLLSRGLERILPRIEVTGWEHVEAARETGRPVLFVTGHLGNWELMSAVFPARGFPVYGVGRELQHAAFHEAVERFRNLLGARTIVRGERGAARRLRDVLRGEAGLVMLIDQDTRVDGVWVPFFDRPAYTPTAAAELGLRHRMTVVPLFLVRRPDRTHECRFLPPVDLPDDVTAATARLTALIEAQIRAHPEQWVWMHRRWRRQPPDATPP